MENDPLWNLPASADFGYPRAPDPDSIRTPRHSRAIFPPAQYQDSVYGNHQESPKVLNLSATAVAVSVFVVFLLLMTMMLLFSEDAAQYTVPWIVVAVFGSVFAFLLVQQWR